MEMSWSTEAFWAFPGLLLCYYLAELFATRKLPGKTPPLVGVLSPLAPRSLINLVYAISGASVAKEGYDKACQINTSPYSPQAS